jgi:hypothetical protein
MHDIKSTRKEEARESRETAPAGRLCGVGKPHTSISNNTIITLLKWSSTLKRQSKLPHYQGLRHCLQLLCIIETAPALLLGILAIGQLLQTRTHLPVSHAATWNQPHAVLFNGFPMDLDWAGELS